MPMLKEQQDSVIGDLAKRLQDGVTTPLHPGDARDAEAIETFLSLSGKTPDRYPGLYSAISRAALGSPVATSSDRAEIVDLGKTAGGASTSSTFVATPGKPFISGAATAVLDATDQTSLAFGSATDVGSGVVRVHTDLATAHPASDHMTAVTFFHAQETPAHAPRFGAVAHTQMTSPGGVLAEVIDPCHPCHSTALATVIGLNRTKGENLDCDYFYPGAKRPTLVVPFRGSKTVPYTISSLDKLGMESSLWLPGAGQSWCEATNLSDLKKYVKVEEGGITWDFSQQAASIRYLPPQNLEAPLAYFFFRFRVPYGGNLFSFTVCSTGYNGSSENCTKIPNILFTWHCVAAGSVVTLADGSLVPIEDTVAGMRVRTGIGDGTLEIEANWRESHEGAALRLATAGGLELELTKEHPVMTPTGLVLAEDLEVGDEVMLDPGGPSPLASIRSIEAGGVFWNLMLGGSADRAAGRGYVSETFVANGVVVGDFDAQGAHVRATRRSFDYMKARLPEEFHRDYESALADSAE